MLSFLDLIVHIVSLFTCLLSQELLQDKQLCGFKNRVYFALSNEYFVSLKLNFHISSSGK